MQNILPSYSILALAGLLIATTGLSKEILNNKQYSHALSIESEDPFLKEWIKKTTQDARRRLTPLLGLSPQPHYPLHIQIKKQQPTEPWVSPQLQAIRTSHSLRFEIRACFPAPHAHEAFLRSFVHVLLYEKILPEPTYLKPKLSLPLAPVWLREGCVQYLLASTSNSSLLIVHRAFLNKKAPTPQDITQWPALSENPLIRPWQQAFVFYLFHNLTLPEKRASFHRYLAALASPFSTNTDSPPSPSLLLTALLPDITLWLETLSHPHLTPPPLLYSYEASATRLALAQTLFLFDPAHPSQPIMIPLSSLDKLQHHPGLPSALHHKWIELQDLELRSHFSWRPIIAWYRQALHYLTLKPLSPASLQAYRHATTQAEKETQKLHHFHAQVQDYLYWFLITQATPSRPSHFDLYYQFRENIESPTFSSTLFPQK